MIATHHPDARAKTQCPASGGEALNRASSPIDGQRAQLAQFLDSYVRVRGHEPSADEIAEFEERNGLLETIIRSKGPHE